MRLRAERTANNLLWGLRFGLIFAALTIAFVSIGYLTNPGSSSHARIGWFPLAASYLLSGLICGLVIGLIRSLITSLGRSIVLGPLVALPFYLTVGSIAGTPFWTWDAVFWTISLVIVVVLGCVMGAIYWLLFA